MSDERRPSFASALSYRDPKAALLWLEEAFGIEPVMVILGADGELAHAEMTFGDGLIMVGSEWRADTKCPASVGGTNTQSVHIHIDTDIDALCERARKAGAEIIMEPENQFYGDRTYRAKDLEGHIWSIGQTVEVMTRDEWSKAGGMTVRDRL